jgi:glucose-1-phosphate cytidylyltransferase
MKKTQIDPKQVPVFILAGGAGTRLSEETQSRPKPMVEIGNLPILLHIMRSYYRHGFNDFVICAGYRSWDIKNYFLNYEFRERHLEMDHRDLADSGARPFGSATRQEKWRVRVIDTGLQTMTGARIARAFDEIAADSSFDHFAVTYGDGLTDADLGKELQFHAGHGLTGTVLAVRPMARFGEIDSQADGIVTQFSEKPQATQGRINGGFFFFKKSFRSYLGTEESCILEREPVTKLATGAQLKVFMHDGFWQPMDTLRDKNQLEALWQAGAAPWLRG